MKVIVIGIFINAFEVFAAIFGLIVLAVEPSAGALARIGRYAPLAGGSTVFLPERVGFIGPADTGGLIATVPQPKQASNETVNVQVLAADVPLSFQPGPGGRVAGFLVRKPGIATFFGVDSFYFGQLVLVLIFLRLPAARIAVSPKPALLAGDFEEMTGCWNFLPESAAQAALVTAMTVISIIVVVFMTFLPCLCDIFCSMTMNRR